MKRKWIFGVLVLLILFSSIAVGCSRKARDLATGKATGEAVQPSYNQSFGEGKPSYDMGVDEEAAAPREDAKFDDGNGGVRLSDIPESGHKIIQTAEITMETLEFEKTVDQIVSHVRMMGGYAEVSNIQGRSLQYKGENQRRTAKFTFRIPKRDFSQFLTDIRAYGSVVWENSRGEDITERYFDTEARLKSLEIREERILAILQEAEKLQDILELERELSEIRYQIENLTGTLKKWDNLVEFSTVYVTVHEVEEIKPIDPPKPKNLWERIRGGFKDSVETLGKLLEDILVGLVVISPFVVVFGGAALLIVLLIRGIKGRRKE